MQGWSTPASRSLLAGLLGSAAWLGVPTQATAQSCSLQNNVYTCTVPQGTFPSTIHATAPNDGPNTTPMEVTSQGDLQIGVSSSQTVGLLLSANGSYNGGNSQGIGLTNSGSIFLSENASTIGLTVDAIFVQQKAGSGNPGGSSVGVSGSGVPAGITIDNSGQITLDLSTLQGQGGAAIWAEDSGGAGGSNQGSSGGDSAGASISNSGTISASLAGQGGFFGIGAISRGGAGGTYANGGAAGPATITNSAAVEVTWAWQDDAQGNDGVFGIAAWSEGGNSSNNSLGDGGEGGGTGQASITLSGDVSLAVTGTPPGSSQEILSAGVAAVSEGGDGGLGDQGDPYGHAGGGGGNAGGADIAVAAPGSGPVSVTTAGPTSPGLLAGSFGGTGGGGGGGATSEGGHAIGGQGGTGGAGGDVSIGLTGGSIATTGASSPGIVAYSEGGIGGDGGGATAAFGKETTGDGGDGGASGDVTVTLDSASGIQTSGSDSVGILAQSLSAAGGDAGGGSGGSGSGGQGGASGNAGNVTVTNGGSISTDGTTARGILVQSMAGAGGSGGSAWGLIHGGGGSGGSAGTTGNVSVTNNGSIVTQGSNAEGVLMQSIGGGGGAGGQGSGPLSTVGGNGDVAGNGGTVDFTAGDGSSIATSGFATIGVLGQSIGGGGGDGGGAAGGVVTVGGSAAGGGAGGAVTGTFDAGANVVGTTGDFSPAVVMQSIGGGGGNAGNAASDELFGSVVIGGTGGGGGNSGSVTIDTNGATITTSGSKSPGLVAQSIGGGGGTGGGALAGSVGPGFAASVAVGGKGGSGGTSGLAAVTVVGGTIATGQDQGLTGNSDDPSSCPSLPCNTLPVDAYGVVVQSIGGGGGHGGSATAKAVAIAVPTPPDIGGQIALGISAAVGGKGGSGAASANGGDAAQFSLSNGGAITTSGQGSTAVLLQSIGGGGGAGGDSSAMSAVLGYDQTPLPDNPSVLGTTISVAVGGTGGPGGAGGEVQAAIGGTVTGGVISQDPTGSNPTSIVTFGDYADGLKAQSIGGGGGDAGIGSGTTQSFGTGNTASVSVTLGSQGGGGGNGGDVTAFLYGGSNGITTYGSGAIGLLAHSIGGGGGSSQGGSVSAAQSFSAGSKVTVKPSLTFSIGATGTGGGNGGDVTVATAAPIVTYGGDATGILAQSIGGGGGVGGSAGSDASSDNPVLVEQKAREFQSEIEGYLDKGSIPQIDAGFSLSLGGSGGPGGPGGSVEVFVEAPITTHGDWANGIVAQSIGGGGGKGGTAAASGTGGFPEITINLDMLVGGNGGDGGDGGNVTVAQGNGETVIRTAGFGAAGVIAQSVGGGGGIGADGSDSVVGDLKLGWNSDHGDDSDGGTVVLNFGQSGATTIATTGDAADGLVLQSIGSGGGIAGAGSSAFESGFQQSGTLQFHAGQGQATSGAGGSVTLEPSAGSQSSLKIRTTGNSSFGILAQSIGGSGGSIISQPSGQISIDADGIGLGGGEASGGGGPVSINLNDQSSITTTGVAAHGVVAQSIGGGGGLIRVVSQSSLIPGVVTNLSDFAWRSSSGTGGDVSVESDGAISVMAPGAIGILAQSVGGGGGIINTDELIWSGSPYTAAAGGDVSVTVNGTVSATGPNGIGIFAQSAGSDDSGSVTIAVNGTVTGGFGLSVPGPGASAIQIDAYNTSSVTLTQGTIMPPPSLGTSGRAIFASNGPVNVYNSGTIIGGMYLNGGACTGCSAADAASPIGTLDNRGTYNSGTVVQGRVLNSGTVNLGMPGEVRSTMVTDDFIQIGEGRLGVTVDSLNETAGHLQVDGTATLDGKIVPTVLTLLPGALPVVTAGHLTSTADGLDSLLFHWDTAQSGNTLTLAPRSDFKPGGVSLNGSQASLAGYYGRAWDNGDKAFATRFAELSTINDHSDYRAALDAWSSKAAHAQSIALANSAGTILGAAMSCPVFIDDTVLLGEDNCVWAKVTGRWTDQSATSDTQGYYVSGTTYRIGAQHEIAPDWYLGASFGFGQSWATMDGGSSGNGDTYDGSVTVKRVMGPWQFAGSVAFAGGSFHSDRRVDIPGIASETLKSDPSIFLAGGRLRAAYEFAFQDWYIRPYGDLDVVYTDLPGFKEKGDDLYALDVRGSSRTGVALSPMVEFGGRLDLDPETALRAYVAFGMSYQPDNTRTIHSSFVGASSANGTFSDQIDSPEVLGRIDVGVQLFRAGGFELKGEYTADVGGSFLSQSASARAAYHF